MRHSRTYALFFGLLLGVATSAGCADSSTAYTPPSPTDAGADLADAAMCQLVPQSGCAAGKKCTTHDAVTTLCDPDGSVNRGERCMTTQQVDNCFAGNACVASSPTVGMCRAFCRTDNDCGSRGYCEVQLGTMGIYVCNQPCNALGSGAGCPSGLSCYAYSKEHTDCRIPGNSGVGQPCAVPEDCQPGMACLGPAGGEACRTLCLRATGSCPAGKSCNVVTYSDGTMWPTYGVCL